MSLVTGFVARSNESGAFTVIHIWFAIASAIGCSPYQDMQPSIVRVMSLFERIGSCEIVVLSILWSHTQPNVSCTELDVAWETTAISLYESASRYLIKSGIFCQYTVIISSALYHISRYLYLWYRDNNSSGQLDHQSCHTNIKAFALNPILSTYPIGEFAT